MDNQKKANKQRGLMRTISHVQDLMQSTNRQMRKINLAVCGCDRKQVWEDFSALLQALPQHRPHLEFIAFNSELLLHHPNPESIGALFEPLTHLSQLKSINWNLGVTYQNSLYSLSLLHWKAILEVIGNLRHLESIQLNFRSFTGFCDLMPEQIKESLRPLTQLKNLKSLDLRDFYKLDVTRSKVLLEWIGNLPSLEFIGLEGSFGIFLKFTADEIKSLPISRLKFITPFHLHGNLSAEDIAFLMQILPCFRGLDALSFEYNFQELRLLTPEEIKIHLGPLSKLRELDIQSIRLTGNLFSEFSSAQFFALLESMFSEGARLKSIDFSNSWGLFESLTPEEIKRVFQFFPKLTAINLAYCGMGNLSFEQRQALFEALGDLPLLESIDFSNNFEKLPLQMKKLFQPLSRLKHLKFLKFKQNRMGPFSSGESVFLDSFEAIADHVPHLERADFSGNKMGSFFLLPERAKALPQALSKLSKLSNLRFIDLSCNNLGVQDREQFSDFLGSLGSLSHLEHIVLENNQFQKIFKSFRDPSRGNESHSVETLLQPLVKLQNLRCMEWGTCRIDEVQFNALWKPFLAENAPFLICIRFTADAGALSIEENIPISNKIKENKIHLYLTAKQIGKLFRDHLRPLLPFELIDGILKEARFSPSERRISKSVFSEERQKAQDQRPVKREFLKLFESWYARGRPSQKKDSCDESKKHPCDESMNASTYTHRT